MIATPTIPAPSLADFSKAHARLHSELLAHHRTKGAEWRQRTPAHHLRHAWVHVTKALVALTCRAEAAASLHLAHAHSRAVMALEVWERGGHRRHECAR